MTDAFIAGIFAGLGVAIPVGAISVLIIDTALSHGFRVGWAAGAGAATVDGFYAAVAALFGTAVAALVAPWQSPLRLLAVAILVAIAVRGILAARRTGTGRRPEDPPTMRRAYLTILFLTLINPMTVVYFAALVLGLPGIGDGVEGRVVFVVGALLASLAWQSSIAGIGALLHHRASVRLRTATSLLGSAIVLAFAARIALDVINA
ncbi:MAG: LysE family transporter [Candidatus Limnocylindrales bacterium]